jgi:hypothetical protein
MPENKNSQNMDADMDLQDSSRLGLTKTAFFGLCCCNEGNLGAVATLKSCD